jgi:hypothetical protein
VRTSGGARPRARHRGADARARVLPHARRGRRAAETLDGRGYRAEALHGGMRRSSAIAS